MKENKSFILCFDCPYCGYQYKLEGLEMMDRRVKCGNCESRFSVRSEMSTVSVKKTKRNTVFNF